jgi:hypothetical protein
MRHAPFVIALIAAMPLAADAKPKGKAKGNGKAKVEFKQHMDAGMKAHKDGKYDVALTELQAAYAIDGQPKLLFAIAQVQSKLDLCPEAVANYEKFLGTIKKDKKKTAVVKQAISACNDKIVAATAVPAEPPPTTTTPPPTTVATTPPLPSEDALVAPVGAAEPPPPTAPPVDDSPLPPSPMLQTTDTGGGPKPWYKDVLGDVLLVGGVATGVGSVVMYTGARSKLDDAEGAPSLAEYNSLVDDAKSQRTMSLVLAGGSAVLITAAIIRYKLRDKGETRTVAVTPTNGGGLITWSGGF